MSKILDVVKDSLFEGKRIKISNGTTFSTDFEINAETLAAIGDMFTKQAAYMEHAEHLKRLCSVDHTP